MLKTLVTLKIAGLQHLDGIYSLNIERGIANAWLYRYKRWLQALVTGLSVYAEAVSSVYLCEMFAR